MKPRDQFGLDALLGRWPAQDPQEHGGPTWDERADKIVAAAFSLKDAGSPGVLDALTAAPPLDPEPGEADSAGFEVIAPAPVIERPSAPGLARKPSDAKRPSLKELAARASQAEATRASMPPAARSSAPPPATVTPITKARSSSPGTARASSPGREDSGVLRLADVAPPAAEAKPAGDKATEKAAPVIQPAAVAAPAPGGAGSRTGLWAGAAIALMGIAAAAAMFLNNKPPPRTDVVADAKPTAAVVTTAAPQPEPPAPVASADPSPAATDAPQAGDTPPDVGATPSATAVASADVKPAAATKDPAKGGKVGTLDEEMKKAVGANDLPTAPQDDGSKPAAGGSGGNLPEQPSQGNAQAAIRSVLGAARACVSGAPDPSSASVTFSSSGSVQSVSVGGWAAANGKSGCVKSALQGAHVSPFARPSYTVPVTIRP
ncbi:MAG: hypothetical protein R3B70_16150 [Polyangiaceae bacterium]